MTAATTAATTAAVLARDHSARDHLDDANSDSNTYFTYRPLSNLPTPPPTYKPPTYKENKTPSAVASGSPEDGESGTSKFRGSSYRIYPCMRNVMFIQFMSIQFNSIRLKKEKEKGKERKKKRKKKLIIVIQ